ncbi:MAG: hypothetical protein HY331_14895 [Chloroflexi bacterium]|nr:hypothetical protein [Chloroflexota bacterium]
MERVYVDFNTMNQDLWSKDRRVLIGRDGARPRSHEGVRVLIGDEDLEVKATLEFDSQHDAWWARPDWSTRRDVSEATISNDRPDAAA